MWWRSVRASAELALNLVGQNLHWKGARRCLGNTGPMPVKYALHESGRRPPMLCVFLLLLALLVAPSVSALPGRLSIISTSPVSDGGPACCCSIAAAERRQRARQQQVARRRLCWVEWWFCGAANTPNQCLNTLCHSMHHCTAKQLLEQVFVTFQAGVRKCVSCAGCAAPRGSRATVSGTPRNREWHKRV
jgi:hypothetical protein